MEGRENKYRTQQEMSKLSEGVVGGRRDKGGKEQETQSYRK